MGRVIDRRRVMQKEVVIHFIDPEVKRICVELWGGKDGGTASDADRVGRRKVKGVPESVTTIEGSAFGSCASLVEAHLPSGLTVLNEGLFCSCGNLERVNIPEGVTTIGQQVFYDCFKFKHVEMPSTVTSIGYNCFYRVGITELVMHAVVPPSLSNGDLGNGSSAKAIYVPDESVEAYKTADGWSRYASVVKPMSERPVGGGNCIVLTLVPSVGERRAA